MSVPIMKQGCLSAEEIKRMKEEKFFSDAYFSFMLKNIFLWGKNAVLFKMFYIIIDNKKKMSFVENVL